MLAFEAISRLQARLAEKVEHQDEQATKNWSKAYKLILKAHDALPL